jgi:MATE family multidrug resistance protein
MSVETTAPGRPQHPFVVRHRDILMIAVPASVAFITEPLAGLIDITVIGRLGDAGMLGGLVLGALVFDFVFSLGYFLRIGTAGLVAQSVGARDPDVGLLHLVRALALAVIIGLVLIACAVPILALANWALAPEPGVAAALSTYFFVRIWAAPFSLINYSLLGWFYGRAAATTGMALQFLIHGVNIVVSILFVFGFGWGIAGAALGTVLGQAAAAIAGLIIMLRHYGAFSGLARRITRSALLDRKAVLRMFGLSRDLMIRSIALMAPTAISRPRARAWARSRSPRTPCF